MKNKSNKKAFTLVELMVSITLISLVLFIAYGMMGSSNILFAKGNTKADIQSNLRLNANYISDEIRYASSIRILSAIPSPIDSTKKYIYSDGGVLKQYSAGETLIIPGSLEGVISELYFDDKDSQNVIFRISGTFNNETYEVESSVFMLNVGTGGVASATGSIIEYVPGIPVYSGVNAKPVTSISIATEPAGTTAAGISETIDFIGTVYPADASEKTLSWSINSSAASYATITATSDNTGRLVLNGAPIGSQIAVKALAMDDSGKMSSEIIITVIDKAATGATTVTVDSPYDLIFKRSGLLNLTATVLPSSTSNKSVTWSINATNSVATISDGVLQTTSTNNSSSDIKVTATLDTNSSIKDDKIIHIIPNITAIILKQTEYESSESNKKYNIDVDISCYVNSENNIAQLSTGIKSIVWTVDNGGTLTKYADYMYHLSARNVAKNTVYNVTVVATPIYGSSFTKITEVKVK